MNSCPAPWCDILRKTIHKAHHHIQLLCHAVGQSGLHRQAYYLRSKIKCRTRTKFTVVDESRFRRRERIGVIPRVFENQWDEIGDVLEMSLNRREYEKKISRWPFLPASSHLCNLHFCFIICDLKKSRPSMIF